jgi:fructose-specific component phosphotransferase system IIB-like protein
MNLIDAPSCGLWPTHRGLVGAVVDADGVLVFAGRLPTDLDERNSWLFHVERHYGASPELVLTEPVARRDPIGRITAECGFTVWVAPLSVVTPLARAAFWRPTPRQLAALLARMPRVASLRAALRLVPRDPGPSQLRFTFPLPQPYF